MDENFIKKYRKQANTGIKLSIFVMFLSFGLIVGNILFPIHDIIFVLSFFAMISAGFALWEFLQVRRLLNGKSS